MQIQLSSEITLSLSTTSVLSGLFHTLYFYIRHLRDLDKEIRILNDKKYLRTRAR